MARKYFGTDGVRGRVGEIPITPDFVMRLGYAAGSVLVARDHLPHDEHPAVLIGKDQPWLNTQAFLAKIDENLQKAMAKA